jgi:hypothetical protein
MAEENGGSLGGNGLAYRSEYTVGNTPSAPYLPRMSFHSVWLNTGVCVHAHDKT